MVTLRQLQVLVETVRAGSFRRAADRLGISAVAVSEQIRSLEGVIGTPLFERKAGLLPELTQSGREVHARAIIITSDVVDLIKIASQKNRGDSRRELRLGVHSYLMRNIHTDIKELKDKYHSVSIVIDHNVHTIKEFVEAVSHGDLDVAYCFCNNQADLPQSEFVRNEPIAIYVSPEHPFATSNKVTAEDLIREPALGLSANQPLARLIQKMFADLGMGHRNIGLETDEFGLIIAALNDKQGYACLFGSEGQGGGESLGFVKVPLEFTLPPLEVRRLTRRSVTADKVLQDVITRIEGRWSRPEISRPS